MCFVVKSKTKWKFNIFPKVVYKFVLKLEDKICESFYYQDIYKLNELKKVSFKKIESYKESNSMNSNYSNYSIGLHYYTSIIECYAQSRLVQSPTRKPTIVKCIIPPFSLRKENNNRKGITNKLKIIKYETI